MERTALKTKLPCQSGGEIKRVANTGKPPVVIPVVVVAVDVHVALVTIAVEDRVAIMRDIICTTAHRILSGLNLVWHV